MANPYLRKPRSPLTILTAALAATGLLVAACGTDSATADSAGGVADLPAASTGADGAQESSSDDTEGTGRETPSDEDIEAVNLAFEQCMADAGVDTSVMLGGSDSDGEAIVEESPPSASQGVEFDEEFAAALEACNQIFEEAFGAFEPSPEEQARFADAEAAFNNCMTEAGFDLGEPDENGGIALELDADTDFDAFEAANDACNNEAFGDDPLFGSPDASEDN